MIPKSTPANNPNGSKIFSRNALMPCSLVTKKIAKEESIAKDTATNFPCLLIVSPSENIFTFLNAAA